jgi:hypothetical protein
VLGATMMDAQDWVRVEEEEPSCCRALFGTFTAPVQAEISHQALKIELHSVLNAFQHSPAYGIHVCESFRDPRKHCMDDYWEEVQYEAISIADLHTLVGGCQREPRELSDEARARLHQFARLLERLSRRIDRVVLSQE